MTIFAERLRALIDLRKSQKRYRSRNEMARAMGLDTGRFGHYATAEREPDIATILLICHELRTHPNYLLGFSDDPDGRYPEEDTRIGDLAKEIRELKLLVKRTRRERD